MAPSAPTAEGAPFHGAASSCPQLAEPFKYLSGRESATENSPSFSECSLSFVCSYLLCGQRTSSHILCQPDGAGPGNVPSDDDGRRLVPWKLRWSMEANLSTLGEEKKHWLNEREASWEAALRSRERSVQD